MATIGQPLVEYRDMIIETGLSPSEGKLPKKTIKRFINLLKQVPDTRMVGMIEYPLYEVLLIAFFSVLGGATTWFEMEAFGRAKVTWLKKVLPLENGIPSHDTFRRLFALVNPSDLEKITVQFIFDNIETIKKSLGIDTEDTKKLICVDGKEQRGTGRKQSHVGKIRNLQPLHVYDASSGICLVSQAISDKRKASIREKKDHYVETIEKAHSQIERRRFYLTTSVAWFEDKAHWVKLRGFVCYEKEIESIHTGKKTNETRYYLTSLKDVDLCAEAIRGHWRVENQLHWHLDSNFGEDANTTMDKNAFNNLSVLNKLCLTLVKLVQPLLDNRSIRGIRKEFGWSFDSLLALLLTNFDERYLKSVLEAHQVIKGKK